MSTLAASCLFLGPVVSQPGLNLKTHIPNNTSLACLIREVIKGSNEMV